MKNVKKLLCVTALLLLVQSNLVFAAQKDSQSSNVRSYMNHSYADKENVIYSNEESELNYDDNIGEDLVLTAAATIPSQPAATTSTVKANNKQSGVISWFDIWKEKSTASGKKAANGAAHKTIKLRTQVSVVNNTNNKKASVVILDRGPYEKGRILDMSKESFSKVESLNKGLFKGTIAW